jgi:hypothetical protein
MAAPASNVVWIRNISRYDTTLCMTLSQYELHQFESMCFVLHVVSDHYDASAGLSCSNPYLILSCFLFHYLFFPVIYTKDSHRTRCDGDA